MAEIPKISEAEWEVMKIVWARWPVTATEIIEALAGRKEWNARTVKTLVNRLVQKGALSHQSQGKRYLYQATCTREQAAQAATGNFAQRIFDGDSVSLLVSLIRGMRLSPDDADELVNVIKARRRSHDRKL